MATTIAPSTTLPTGTRAVDPAHTTIEFRVKHVGLDVVGVLDRRDFGLTWNKAVDGGGLLVGNRVDVRLELSAVRRP